jgi:hypothetical protein
VTEHPCPWCGGTIRDSHRGIGEDGQEYVVGKCDGCNAGSITVLEEPAEPRDR